jgi:hypothetical protein
MRARGALVLALILAGLGAVAFIWWRQQRPPASPPAPIQAHVLKKSELTPAEIKYGRAPQRHPSVTYEDDVVIVEGGADVIRSVTPDGLVWTIDARARHASELSVGKIAFVTGRCVGRVLYLKREGDTLNLVLGPVELTDVFRTLEITVTQPIDLSEVIEVPPPQFQGVKFPLQDKDAALPEWSVPPIPLAAPHAPASRDAPFILRPISRRDAEPQVSPVTPGIPQRLNLTFQTRPLINTDGIGAELRHEGRGMIVIAQVQLRAPKPDLEFDLRIVNKQLSGSLVLKNTVGLRLAFDGSVGEAFSGNAYWRGFAPGFTIPVGGPAPIEVTFRHEIWVRTAFSAKQTVFTAGGEYGLNTDIGLRFQKGAFSLVGPEGLTVERSLMRNMNTISLGPNGVVISHVATMTGGLGVGGFTTGPTFDLATSVGVAQGPSIALIQCEGATLSMNVRGGVGWTIPQKVAQFINAVFSIFGVKPIPDHGGVYTPWKELFKQHAQTESKVCGGPGT